MKVVHKNHQKRGRSLSSVSHGTTISFCKQFHQDHCVSDIFIVMNDNGYLNEYCHRYPDKICVVNIETGKLSVVDRHRECYKVLGAFCVDD